MKYLLPIRRSVPSPSLTWGLWLLAGLALTLIGPLAALAANKAVKRCLRAGHVLEEIMDAGDRSIPQDLLNKAQCVAIMPGVIKAGLGLGGKYGRGIISCRAAGGQGWTAPSSVRVEGGSIGFQIGGSSTDFVLLVMNERGAEKLLQSKFTLGADASVAGGPVGRTAEARTDAQMSAEILSYSRSKGLFAGVSLEGATLRPSHDANEEIYGRTVDPKEVLAGNVPAPSSVQPLIATLTRYSARKHE